MSDVHHWRRPLRWARNILLGLVGLVTVVVLGAYVFFETSTGRNVLRSQIEARLAKGFVGGATLGGVDGNPLSELVLQDLVIFDAKKQPAIKIERLAVKLPLMPLLSHQLRVDKIAIAGLDVLARREADGTLNLATLKNPSEPSTWNVKLPDVSVQRGHIRYEGAGEPIDIDNLEVFVDAALPFAGPIDAALSLSADWRQKQAPIRVAANLHVDDEEVRIGSGAIQLADIDVALTQLAIAKGPYMQPVGGVVSVYAPRDSVRMLAPTVNVPGDVALVVTSRPEGRLSRLVASAGVGASHLRARIDADLQAKLARGVIDADHLDLTALTQGRLQGGGGGVISFDVDANDPTLELPVAHATINGWGQAGRAPRTTADISLASDGRRVVTVAKADSESGLHAAVDASIIKAGARITLERADIVARTADARRASQGLVPLRGSLDANLHAAGTLAPRLEVDVHGDATGRQLRFDDIRASSFALRIDAKNLPTQPVGSARLEVTELKRGTMELGQLTLAAGNRPDGKLQVTVRSQPKPAPWRIDLDALVAMGTTTNVEIQRHVVRAAGGSVWRGTSGTLTLSPQQIQLRGFESRSGDGRIAADATFVRAGRRAGDLQATLDTRLDLASLHKGYRGTIEAHVDASRERGRLAGVIDAKGSGLVLNPKMQGGVGGHVKIDARAGKLVADVGLDAAKAGQVRLALDVDAPANITDARAWRRLGRNAVENAQVTLTGIDLSEAAKLAGIPPEEGLAGSIEGDLRLTPSTTGGAIRVRGVQTRKTRDLGTIEADVEVAPAGNQGIRTMITARLQPTEAAIAARDVTRNGAARFLVDAKFQTPERLFDPAAWKAMGPEAFEGGTIRAERLAFQPGTLERLGIVSDMRGEVAIGADIEPALRAARIGLNIHNLRGGLFAKPVAISLSAILDNTSARLIGSVVGDRVTLLDLTGSVPVSLEQLRADPQAAKTAPLSVVARMNQVPARSLLAVLGNTQVLGGVLDGMIKVAGTATRPTVRADIVARDITVPQEGTKPTQALRDLTIAATWDGAIAKAAIDGNESGGGTLRLRAQADPTELATATASFDASRLDLAPLVAFMPGPAGALGGMLDAHFTLRGADPRTADLQGNLHVSNGRIPIAPAVGTLFQGDLKLGVANRTVGVNLTGKLGRGDVKLVANAPLDGATPKSGTATLTLRKVQLIGTTEPIISGTINANIARVDEVWRAEVSVDRMDVDVPEGKGTKLSPVGAPADVVYGGAKIHHGKNKGQDVPKGIVHREGPADFKPPSQVEGPMANRKEPEAQVAAVHVRVRNVFVVSKEARGLVAGNLRLTVGANKEVGIVGQVSMSRAVLDLFNRRYQVDRANLQFDGSPDPVVDVRITHDFPEVTTITEVRGRLSKPQLALSSNPGQYSQAELLGFLLGGEPGGDPENAPSATSRVANAGASFLANKIAAPIKKALPVDIDVLRYETASATSSAAVTVGTWITDTLFLAYRRHLEARPDENTGEGELEYWIQRRLVLEAVAGDRGRNGLDLLWRRRW